MMERWTNERGFLFSFNFESRDVEKKGAVRGGAYTLNFLANVNTTRAVKKRRVFMFLLPFVFIKKFNSFYFLCSSKIY